MPLRWVISRDPIGVRETRIYFSTDPTLSGLDILLAFTNRWSAEVTFEEGRAHLGIETQRQWSDSAIERSPPCLFALYSLVTLLGRLLYPKGGIPVRQAAWYHKKQADHEVLHGPEGIKKLNHPQAGHLAFEHLMFQVYDKPDLEVVVYMPLKQGETAAKIPRVLQTNFSVRLTPDE